MRVTIWRLATVFGLTAAPALAAGQLAPPDSGEVGEKLPVSVALRAPTGVASASPPSEAREAVASSLAGEQQRIYAFATPARPAPHSNAIGLTATRLQGRPQSWWPPLASAILPGAGQGLLRQDRALAYLAVESYGWIRYASDVREGRRQRHAYRALAAQVARAYLSEGRPVGDFEYYERMEHYIESGVFDANADAGIQPETDPESFNGFIWLRARTTFWEDPAIPPPPTSQPYFAALEYYADRAIQPEFRWSWRNAQLEQDLFRRTIGRSNDAFRRSIQDLGVIIANHALSTVDAYVTVRIRHAREASGVGFEASIPWSPRKPGNRTGNSTP